MAFIIEDNILKGVTNPIDADHKLGKLIYTALKKSPDHVSQIDAQTGEQTTCREMKDRSIRCALWMKKLGIGPQDIIVVVTHNHLDSYIPVFATFFVDAIFSAWYHGVTLYSAQRFMKKFSPKVIFTCEKAVDVLTEAAKLENVKVHFVVFGKHFEIQSLSEILDSQTKKEVDEFEVVDKKSPQDVAAIMLSSGTTGFPKGVMLKNWISCVALIIATLLNRYTRIIPGNPDAKNFFKIIEKYKVNLAFIPPVLVMSVAKSQVAQNYDLRSLKNLMVGGSKLSKQVLEGLQQRLPTAFIGHGYGATEVGGISSATSKTEHIESTGFVRNNCEIKFIDLTTGKTLGPNQKGEVYAKTPNVMIGYYKDPVATKQAFDEEGWYRTGDIGYYNEAGEIFIVDRIKEIMKCKYYHVSPAEIEELLLSHAEVQEAAVVAIPHEIDGDWPVAFVKKIPGSKITVDDLMKLTSVLEDYKKLRGGIYFLDSLPQTPSGKIAKNELRKFSQQFMNNVEL